MARTVNFSCQSAHPKEENFANGFKSEPPDQMYSNQLNGSLSRKAAPAPFRQQPKMAPNSFIYVENSNAAVNLCTTAGVGVESAAPTKDDELTSLSWLQNSNLLKSKSFFLEALTRVGSCSL